MTITEIMQAAVTAEQSGVSVDWKTMCINFYQSANQYSQRVEAEQFKDTTRLEYLVRTNYELEEELVDPRAFVDKMMGAHNDD